MATFNSDLYNQRTVMRTITDSEPQVFIARFRKAIGEQMTAADVYKLGILAAGHTVTKITVVTDDLDDGTTITSTVGYLQLAPGTGYAGTNSSGVSTDYGVDTEVTGASPATSAAYFVATGATFGQAAGISNPTIVAASLADPNGLAGPVVMTWTVEVTPTQTTADDSVRNIKFLIEIIRSRDVAAGITQDQGGY